jgi:hypothetical protein
MQIQLKQTEIVAALKMYIEHQGISLHNRVVDVAFTAGRKDSGLSADIDIQDFTRHVPPEEEVPISLDRRGNIPDANVEVVVEEEPLVTESKSLFG